MSQPHHSGISDKNHRILSESASLRAFSNKNHRIVSGARATGRLHLGHYYGVLKNWLKLQSEYPCFFFIADWHALTTQYEHPQKIKENTHEMVLDMLGVGIDPNLCTFFVQSDVPEHVELHLILSMLTPLSWLERVPTYKELRQKLKEQHLGTYGFLGYPVLQSADVLIHKGELIPVGEDQIPHIELTREIARHFNHLYGQEKGAILPEPQPLLTTTSKMPGLDGQKMSKSYHNVIELREDPKSVEHKIKVMPTDPARVRRTDPGEPEKCPVWRFHQIYSSPEVQTWVLNGCRSAGIGCIECKRPVIDAIIKEQAPIRARAEEFEKDKILIHKILKKGADKARESAQETLKQVKEVMGLSSDLGVIKENVHY